jgi:hypothetical protein
MTLEKTKKKSLIFKLTGLIFAGFIIIIFLVSLVFITAFRRASYREVEKFVMENISRVQDNADAHLWEMFQLLDYTSMGALPMITTELIDVEKLEAYFFDMAETV